MEALLTETVRSLEEHRDYLLEQANLYDLEIEKVKAELARYRVWLAESVKEVDTEAN
jgi:hypothetical protein